MGFSGEIYQAPRSWAERAFPKIIYGGHHDCNQYHATAQRAGS
jgi:hypothetical protein